MDGVVGRLQHDDQVGLEDERRLGEDARQRALLDRQLLADEEEEREVVGRPRAARRRPSAASSTITASAALHVAGAEADHAAVLDPPGQVVLRRNGVEVAGEEDERPPGSLGREEQRLVGRVGEREGHRVANVVDEPRSSRLGDGMFTSSSVRRARSDGHAREIIQGPTEM